MAKCTKGWYDRCSRATSRKCTCGCGGENHGVARPGIGNNNLRDLTSLKPFSQDASPKICVKFNDVPRYIILRRLPDGSVWTNVPRVHVYHSPTGFEWGYSGSGPADLALNIVSMFVPGFWAMYLHQQFKEVFIALIPREGGQIHTFEILVWLTKEFRKIL